MSDRQPASAHIRDRDFPDSPAPFIAADGLAGVARFAGIGLGLVVLNRLTGWGVPCPVLHLTGWLCPFCGATRMGTALLSGQVASAFWWNPFVFLILAVLALCSVVWLVELLGGPAWRPFSRWRRISSNQIFSAVGVVGVVFMVVRNLA